MTTSAKKSLFLLEIIEGKPIPKGKLSYFRTRLSNKLHEVVLDLFEKLSQEKGLTKRELALRIGKDPAQITRLFGAPGNWELDTVSDLLLGMGCELHCSASDLTAHVQPDNSAVTQEKAIQKPSKKPTNNIHSLGDIGAASQDMPKQSMNDSASEFPDISRHQKEGMRHASARH